jgi:hypothetical protein
MTAAGIRVAAGVIGFIALVLVAVIAVVDDAKEAHVFDAIVVIGLTIAAYIATRAFDADPYSELLYNYFTRNDVDQTDDTATSPTSAAR